MITQLHQFASSPEVSIGPQILFHIGPWIVTNTQMLGLLGTLIILAVTLTAVMQIRRGSRSRLMHAVTWAIEGLYDTTTEVIGDRAIARKVFPYAVTLVLFFMINNWLGILPFVGSVKYHGVELFRGVAADMNTTFALAIISMGMAQAWAIKRHGFFGNLGRYFVNPIKDPLASVAGFLEVIGEISRLLALSLRMFGNVFGGEVLLAVIAYLTSYAAPLALPLFYCLELFVGAIQAYVFFMLTIAFVSLGLEHEEGDAHETGADGSAATTVEAAQ